MYFALTSYYSLCYLLNAGNFTYRLLAMEAIAKQMQAQRKRKCRKKSLQNSLNAFLHSSYQVEKIIVQWNKIYNIPFSKIGSCCVSTASKMISCCQVNVIWFD